MAFEPTFTAHGFCPRCDRMYSSAGKDANVAAATVLEIIKEHVSKQHPDHDPDWAEDPEIAPAHYTTPQLP